jgi:carbonic anhydrase
VRAAYLQSTLGLIDNWLRHVHDVRERHDRLIGELREEDVRINRLCELNVIEQVRHVAETTIVRDAWRRGQTLVVHGWIYDIRDGLLRDLRCTVTTKDEVASVCESAVQ